VRGQSGNWLSYRDKHRKSPFSKIFFEKGDRNAKKNLVFYVPSTILAIFEPVVGDFYEHFSNQRFIDSLVGQPILSQF